MKTNLQMHTNKKVDLFYPELSYQLVGICYQVHNETGGFAKEKQYGDAYEKKLKELGIKFVREFIIGNTGNTVDFFIDDKIILEFKAKRFLLPGDFVQTQRYLQATGVKLGILINFGPKLVQAERVVLIESGTGSLIRKHWQIRTTFVD